jgi:outer membrane protein TolC
MADYVELESGSSDKNGMTCLSIPTCLRRLTLAAAVVAGGFSAAGQVAQDSNAARTAASPSTVLNLDQCLQMALEKNHRRPASGFEVAMAEAQHKQALAAYWPQINLKAAYQLMDQPFNFVFPSSSMQIPAQNVSIPGGSSLVTIPANAFGPGFPPSNVQLPVSFPGQTVASPAQNFAIPEQNVKVLDRNLATGSLDMKWLVLDGGMRKGLREESNGYVEMMRAQANRTDLEVADEVRRMYWGAVLARQVHQVGQDTLARMEVTLHLTESLYKNSAGRVSKTDYLDNRVMVESLRSMVASLEKNDSMAGAALANSVGLPWNAGIQPANAEIPFEPYAANLENLVDTSYQFSPDWRKLEAAIRAAEGAITTARSGYYPKLALTGELHNWWNGGYDGGISTAQNRSGWSVGVGLEFPLFDGMLTRNKVGEAVARLNQLKENRFLLREGLGLQIKDLFLGLSAAAKASQSTAQAMQSATESRDLYERAYQNELVETEKVIRAQLVEALMAAQHFKARFDYVALTSQLNLVVGTEIQKSLKGSVK